MWSKSEYEKYAMTALALFYPELSGMTKCESPDYCNGTIGVEIRRAVTKNDGETDAFWRKNQNRKYKELPPKLLIKLGFKDSPLPFDSKGIIYSQRSLKNGCLYYYKQKGKEDYILCAYIGKVTTNQVAIENIYNAIAEKLSKLNDHYQINKQNDLCILIQEQLNYFVCQDDIVDDLVNSIVSSIKTAYKKQNYTHYFDNIYLLFLDNVFRIDTKTWELTRNRITQMQTDHILSQMREM